MNTSVNVSTWLQALRSGEYKQYTGSMVGPEPKCYCALGLGLKLTGFFKTRRFLSSAGPYLETHLGLNAPQRARIVIMNDDEKLSFDQIADTVEKWLNTSK